MSFAKLKNRRGNLDRLTQEAEKLNGGDKKYGDDRIWKVARDKSGNGYAVIRFLPEAPDNDVPWNSYWDHGFKGPNGQWYIERSLTSLGQTDPVGELNSEMWNNPSKFGMDSEEAQKVVRMRKRRLHYVANVYVVSDPANPQNEGKVMIYQFGKKIFDKLMDAMKPQYEDEEAVNPFDFWKGANFKIKVRMVDGWVNYDKSEFASVEPLSNDDEELEKIYNQLHDLREFTDPANYKTYNELKARLGTVLGTAAAATPALDEAYERSEPRQEREAPAPTLASAEGTSFDEDPGGADENEDTLSYFARLASAD